MAGEPRPWRSLPPPEDLVFGALFALPSNLLPLNRDVGKELVSIAYWEFFSLDIEILSMLSIVQYEPEKIFDSRFKIHRIFQYIFHRQFYIMI